MRGESGSKTDIIICSQIHKHIVRDKIREDNYIVRDRSNTFTFVGDTMYLKIIEVARVKK